MQTETLEIQRKSGIAEALLDLRDQYRQMTPGSMKAVSRASEVIPGGETRSVLQFSPYPLVFKSAHESKLVDVDGNAYIDFINDFGAGLYGHSQPAIQQSIVETVAKGLTIGGISELEGELALLLVERFPALEKVRFTNSGTEANLMALTAARAVTGKDKIMVMNGAYHGSVLCFDDRGSRANAPYDYVYGQFNDLKVTLQNAAPYSDQLAAILVEPMLGAGGAIPADRAFLNGLREFADQTGALLIFDEVLTSRVGASGAQGFYEVTPDLMTCGKYLGGGGSFGAFGGRSDLMDIFDSNRENSIAHGGTFNNNVITMAAGVTGLRDIFTQEKAESFLLKSNEFRAEINSIAERMDVAVHITGLGPIFGFHFQNDRPRKQSEIKVNSEATALFHMAMLVRGIYLASRAHATLSIALTDDDFAAFKEALVDVFSRYRSQFNESALAARDC